MKNLEGQFCILAYNIYRLQIIENRSPLIAESNHTDFPLITWAWAMQKQGLDPLDGCAQLIRVLLVFDILRLLHFPITKKLMSVFLKNNNKVLETQGVFFKKKKKIIYREKNNSNMGCLIYFSIFKRTINLQLL